MATQGTTVRGEILGSSNGGEQQSFLVSRAPVLAGQEVEVREPQPPSASEMAVIAAEEGHDAVAIAPETGGGQDEIWVRWHEVPDFYASGPRDRHYVLDHVEGTLSFGDGRSGMIPPRGAANIRAARYSTGVGAAGNQPAATIVQLKTTVPYVDGVTNPAPAAGGVDAEAIPTLMERAPRLLRHGQRAVAAEDYEDLARLASPEVARAKCLPLFNPRLGIDGAVRPPHLGSVTVMVVPHSAEPKPLPSPVLLDRVQSFLRQRCPVTADVSVVGAFYVAVDVRADISLTSINRASDVQLAVSNALDGFLHPLTGGLDGTGWEFGRLPHRSDLYSLLQGIPGVDHVGALDFTIPALNYDPATVRDPDIVKMLLSLILVCAGTHRIRLGMEA
jgi:predicted phage baseplate assembly protein